MIDGSFSCADAGVHPVEQGMHPAGKHGGSVAGGGLSA
jgi:hypothetical protein